MGVIIPQVVSATEDRASGAQVIDGSLKIVGDNDAHLTRTLGANGSTAATFSLWIKKGDQGVGNSPAGYESLVDAYVSSATYTRLFFNGYALAMSHRVSNNENYLVTSALFRDTGWYHIVGTSDSNGHPSVYVNGVQYTDYSASSITFTQTSNAATTSGATVEIATQNGRTDRNFDGLISNFYFIDGQALGPGYFGFTDPLTNTWRPKKFRAEGTTVNDGTVWSDTCTFTRPTSGFNGTFDTANAAYLPSAGTGTITTAPFTIRNNLRIYNNARSDQGGQYTVTINGQNVSFDGTGTSSTAYRWTEIDLSGFALPIRVTNLQYTVPGSSGTGFDAIEVDGVIMLDSTTQNLAFGTNGFYLPVDNEDDFGQDKSGNGNDFTQNNFSGTFNDPDVLKDSPSGAVSGGPPTSGITTTSSAPSNYATLNPLDNGGGTLSDGNLNFSHSSASYRAVRSNIPFPPSGKWYFETTIGSNLGATVAVVLGIAESQASLTNHLGSETYSYAYGSFDGKKLNNQSTWNGTAYGNSFTNGDVISIAFDSGSGSLYFYKNGIDQGGGTAAYTGLTASTYFPAISLYGGGGNCITVTNFGQKPFKYAPPQGYLPLNSASVRPETVIARPDQYVGTSTWSGAQSGSGGLTRQISTVFQPDFVWIKQRNQAYTTGHQLYDSVRGAGAEKELNSSGTAVEGAGNIETYGWLNSFDKTGFTVKGGSTDYDYVDKSGVNYVAWTWKAGGNKNTFNVDDVGYATASAAGLDGGTITPTGASVGTKQGFSIIEYAGTGAVNTISHGLNTAPELIFFKSKTNTENWAVYSKANGAGNRLILNLNVSSAAGSNYFNNTEATSSVFTVGHPIGQVNGSGQNYIAYCWSGVSGFSKFGSFTAGTEPFVELGFKPALVIIKRTAASDGWVMIDGTRNPYNPSYRRLEADTNGAESSNTSEAIDILSNGFKIKSTWGGLGGSSGSGKMIYAAWAEAPTSNLYGAQSNAR